MIGLFRRKHERRAKALAQWGKRKPFNENLYYERQLFDHKSADFSLDEQTAKDLDFDRVFNYVDRTTSVIGQQCLYDRMRCAESTDTERNELEEAVQFYEGADPYPLLKPLGELRQGKDYIFPAILYEEVPHIPAFRGLVRGLQLVSFACLLFGIIYPVLWLVFVPIMAINLFVHYRINQDMGLFVDVFSRLKVLHAVGEGMLDHAHFGLTKTKELLQSLKRLKRGIKGLSFLQLDRNLASREGANVGAYLMEVVKFATLLDVVTYYALLDQLPELRVAAADIYYAIGEVDIALSVLALRATLPYFIQPEITENSGMKVSGVYHPLIDQPIANDLSMEHAQGMLVTGSNMSGKSTFIKTLNVNALCAQTLNTAFAHSYSSRSWRLLSSMNTTDQLAEGSSYYLEEVDRIGTLLKCSEDQEHPYLLTIDEVFRGTNTIERISSAKAVLDYLVKGDSLVLVSTHDLELAKLLEGKYDLYYFQEAVTGETLSFDYQLKPGVMTERNAIKILSLAGYPLEVVREAGRVADSFGS